MRTTVDIEDGLLERAKRLALKEKQTLGAVVSEALAAYLGGRSSGERSAIRAAGPRRARAGSQAPPRSQRQRKRRPACPGTATRKRDAAP